MQDACAAPAAAAGALLASTVSAQLHSRDAAVRAAGLRAAASALLDGAHNVAAGATALYAVALAASCAQGGAWHELSPLASRGLVGGPQLDALLLLLLVFPHVAGDGAAVRDPALWRALQSGIQAGDSNRHHRKAAVAVLKAALAALGGGAAVASPSWATYLVLLDGLEDMVSHLILDLWPRARGLAEEAGGGAQGWAPAGPSPPSVTGPPDLSLPVPAIWVAALLNRAFTSDVAQSKRNLLLVSLGASDLMRDERTRAEAHALDEEEEEEEVEGEGGGEGGGDAAALDGAAVASASEPVHGDYVGTYVKKAWQSAGPTSPFPLHTALLSRMPPWYISGSEHFMGCLTDHAMFAGSTAGFSRAVGRFLVAYARVLVEKEGGALYPPFLRALVDSLQLFAHNKGALKAVVWALPCLPLIPPTVAQLHAPTLAPSSLSHLRWTLLSTSHVTSRALTEALMRKSARFVLRFTTLDCDVDTLAPLAHFLCTLPSSVCFDAAAGSAYTLQQGVSVQAELRAWAARAESGVLSHRLADMYSAWIAGGRCGGSSGVASAAGLARLLVLACEGLGSERTAIVLRPLADALSTVHSHTYMAGPVRTRALLLLRALLCVSWPSGGNSDLHLSRNIAGAAVPAGITEYAEPLYADWCGANRASAAAYPGMAFRAGATLDSMASVPEVSGGEDEDDVEAASDSLRCMGGGAGGVPLPPPSVAPLRAALQLLLAEEAVSSDVASCVEGCLATGLSLTDGGRQGGGLWAPDVPAGLDSGGGLRGHDDDASTPPLLNTTFYLALLRDCLRTCPRAAPFTATAARLVSRAAGVVQAPWSGTGLGQGRGPLRLDPAGTVRHANALHVLAVLLASILPSCVHPVLLPELGDSLASTTAVRVLLSRLLGGAVARPAGAEEPALPLGATEAELDAAPRGMQAVPWLSVRTLAERARWVAVEPLLAHGAVHGWGAEPTRPVSLAGLPLEDAEALAESVCDSVDSASSSDVHVVARCAAWATPFCVAAGEDPDDVAATLSATAGRPVRPVTSVSLESLLTVLGQQVWGHRPSRGELLAYTSAVLHPALFLRPHLHGPTGVLMRHLVKSWTVLSDDQHMPVCAQIFAARLLCAYTIALRVGGDPAHPLRAHASAVLAQHGPLLVALLMHRECVLPWDDSQLVDSHSRVQLLAWLEARRTDATAPPVYWKSGCVRVQVDLGGGEGGEPPEVQLSGPPTRPDLAAVLPARGAGGVTRIQALTWVEFAAGQACGGNAPATLLLQAVVLQLTRLNTLPDWCKNSAAGAPQHAAKLRAWQALALLSASLGRLSAPPSTMDAPPREPTDAYGFTYVDTPGVWVSTPDRKDAVEAAMAGSAALTSSFSLGAVSNRPTAGVGKKTTFYKGASSTVDATTGPPPSAPSAWAVAMHTLGDVVHPPVAVALTVLHVAFAFVVAEAQTPSLRHHVESAAVALSRRFPCAAIRGVLLPLLGQYNPRSQAAFSLMLVVSDLVRYLSALHAAHPTSRLGLEAGTLGKLLLSAIFPWLTCPVGLVRLLAQLAVTDAVPLLFPDAESGAGPDAVGLQAWVLPTLHLVKGCAEVSEMVQRQRKHLIRIDPATACSLEGLLTSAVTEHGELVPFDVFSSIRGTFQSLTLALHARDPLSLYESDSVSKGVTDGIAAGLLPRGAIHDSRLRSVGVPAPVPAGGEGRAASAPESSEAGTPSLTYQRKVLSASEAPQHAAEQYTALARALVEVALQAPERGGTGGGGDALAGAGEAVGAPPSQPSLRSRREHPLLTCVDDRGRSHQPLVLVASLLDKAPNLGGLARTCEIFSAESLVVHDARVREDPSFKDTAVTAADWMPLHEVPRSVTSLMAYLLARKAQGYTVAALEQASRSVLLGTSPLPDKLVLLLGAEKRGVPAELLSLVDLVIEIPQTGVIRSLNVHVSAALVVWQYTRDRLAGARGGEA